jgi:hypothetical protein
MMSALAALMTSRWFGVQPKVSVPGTRRINKYRVDDSLQDNATCATYTACTDGGQALYPAMAVHGAVRPRYFSIGSAPSSTPCAQTLLTLLLTGAPGVAHLQRALYHASRQDLSIAPVMTAVCAAHFLSCSSMSSAAIELGYNADSNSSGSSQ